MFISAWLRVGVLMLLPLAAVAGDGSWVPVANQVIGHLDQALERYRAGDAEAARRDVVQAYFGPFEGEQMEAAIRSRLGTGPAFLLERQFGAARKAIQSGAPAAAIEQDIDQLKQALLEHAALLDEASVPRSVYKVNQ